MKRLLSLLLSLLLVCSIAYPTARASQMIDTSDAGTLRLYSAGDTILAQGDRLYRWDASAQTPAGRCETFPAGQRRCDVLWSGCRWNAFHADLDGQ